MLAKAEWNPSEPNPRVGFIVTNLSRPAERGYLTFQLAEEATPRDRLADILRRVDRLRPKPFPK